MIRLSKNKKSQYIVYLGWGGCYYADKLEDIKGVFHSYGKDKIKYEKIKR